MQIIFLLSYSYINFIMSIPETYQALKKSQTHSFALPNINKTRLKLPVNYKTSRSAAKTRQHNSLFLEKIKDLTKDVKYDEMQTANITDEQKELKKIVREFNNETYHILGRYLDKASMAVTERKQISNTSQTTNMRGSRTRGHSTSMKPEVQEKQILNSQQAMEICKRQLVVLEKRSENLKYVTTEEFSRKIESTREEIQEQKQVIKEILRNNTLRGLSIKKGDDTENHEVSELEYEKFILEKKKQRLLGDTNYVKEEQDNLKNKHTEADKKIQDMATNFSQLSNEDKQSKEQAELRRKFDEKKKQLFLKKQKKQIVTGSASTTLQKSGNGSTAEMSQTNRNENQSSVEQKQGNQKVNKQKKKAFNNSKFQAPLPISTSKYQHSYLKLLKQLDEVMSRTSSYEQAMGNAVSRVQECRIEIMAYEQKLSQLKKAKGGRKNEIAEVDDVQNDKNKSPQSIKKGFMDSFFA